jgi:hypothetical protein
LQSNIKDQRKREREREKERKREREKERKREREKERKREREKERKREIDTKCNGGNPHPTSFFKKEKHNSL